MERRIREAVRYLGYGKHAVDDRTSALITDSFAELEKVAEKRSVYRVFQLSVTEEQVIISGNIHIRSRNLAKNLKNCGEAVVFAATLGSGVDLLMKRYTLTDMAKVVVLQACAAALLEEYCDGCQERIAEELKPQGKYLHPRFSPGYGDFLIAHQKDLLSLAEAGKRIGLAMTDSSMLTPVKSVTALMGISHTKEPCHRDGCEACTKTDCIYRRS